MLSSHAYGLILAGGRGTRFWPRSRRNRAKQVLPFTDERSLIQHTVERLRPLLPPERLWVITNDHLRGEITAQLPDVPPSQILAEPAARNTAPCIGLAAHILQSLDPEAVLGVFPSDHHIENEDRYRELLVPAFEAAAEGRIAVLGLQPRWAETGYGYIEFGGDVRPGELHAVAVQSFREKPNRETAEQFVAARRFFWNAGMFFFRAATMQQALRQHLPRTAGLLDALPSFADAAFSGALAETFPRCESISIDYAVMEREKNVVGVAADDIGWNDLGSWDAVYELLEKDEAGNVVRADALVRDGAGCYVDAPQGRIVAMLGVRDLIVVDTPDALLIADRSRAQEVGDLVKELEKQGREDLL